MFKYFSSHMVSFYNIFIKCDPVKQIWIPQILNPNPDAMSKMITENASKEFLHSLSNYCTLQGFVEDQFGLGLIARAVEEDLVLQAADTDISALVEIEKNSPHRFEFFMGHGGDQPICARTA
ncbi:methionine S-methyltransferase-like isoform X2 [Henckelia pumila]|uniref:methionine S-methyltransferase-like isoform X2 n=1 Tax=Henckelia pumila TaxID=405737 RepID=UPI003C6E2DE5